MVTLAALPSFDLGFTFVALGFVAVGVLCGTLSGLTPGLHANNFALLMAAVAPTVQDRRHWWARRCSQRA